MNVWREKNKTNERKREHIVFVCVKFINNEKKKQQKILLVNF